MQLPDGSSVSLSDVDAGEVRLRVAQAGEGPPVVLLHGFPELWWSWRHQIGPIAAAGFRVIAPDLRGYGGSDAPPGPQDYTADKTTADVTGLLDALGEHGPAVVVGHDWGASLAWSLALREPGRVRAVAGLSVPFLPRPPLPPVQALREAMGDDFYVVWFQEPGVADAALARDVRRTLQARDTWGGAWAERDDIDPLPPWKTEAEQQFYVDEFERTGFTGGLNWYRAMDRDWELSEPYAGRRIEQPALYLVGSRDQVLRFAPPSLMDGWVPNLESHVVEGAGHWVQQQAPAEVNEHLLRWLAAIPPVRRGI